MLTALIFISIALLISVALFQFLYVFAYIRQISQPSPAGHPAPSFKVAVILCLRGADPDLMECLIGLHRQHYSTYEVHLILDCDADPAHAIVQEFNESRPPHAAPPQYVHILDPVSGHGSLKCQGIIHVIGRLDRDIEVVALIDADTIVDSDWLPRLVQPLADDSIGASTGNRWFTPIDNRIGSWVRQTWNAAAIVQMQLYQIAWGGSLAIKTEVIESTGLLDKWSRALCEDTMISSALESNGLRVHRVASLVVDNHESTSLSSCNDWIIRQLLTVRLHHKLWPLVLMHALNVGLALCVPLLTAIVAALFGQWVWVTLVFVAWVLFQMGNIVLIQKITKTNLGLISESDLPYAHRADYFAKPYPLWFSILLAQLIQPWAAIQAAIATTTNWRGIQYAIGKTGVEMEKYSAFHEPAVTIDEDGSPTHPPDSIR